jgi:hypothetical protein
MSAILSAIYCLLADFLYAAWDLILVQWDGLLAVGDSLLSSIGSASWAMTVIPTQYAWILGATGCGEALTIIATALGIRFLLQSIPFVRWGT